MAATWKYFKNNDGLASEPSLYTRRPTQMLATCYHLQYKDGSFQKTVFVTYPAKYESPQQLDVYDG